MLVFTTAHLWYTSLILPVGIFKCYRMTDNFFFSYGSSMRGFVICDVTKHKAIERTPPTRCRGETTGKGWGFPNRQRFFLKKEGVLDCNLVFLRFWFIFFYLKKFFAAFLWCHKKICRTKVTKLIQYRDMVSLQWRQCCWPSSCKQHIYYDIFIFLKIFGKQNMQLYELYP